MPAVERNIFNEDTARRFWQEQRQRAENPEPGESIDFSGMTFPEDPDGLYFHGVCFTTLVDFSDTRFEANYVFNKTKFCCEAIFRNASFPLGCLFTECVFEDDVSFESAKFEKHAYLPARFKSRADFTAVVFAADVVFGDDESSAIFEADAIFNKAIFEDIVVFEGVTFEKKTNFKGARFRYWTQFISTTFNGRADFGNTVFDLYHGPRDKRRNVVRFFSTTFNEKVNFWDSLFLCRTRFQNVTFNGDGEFRKTSFRNKAEFINCIANSRLYFDRSYKDAFINCADAIEPYRLAKQTAINKGDFRWAGRYYYQEQCAINKTERTNITGRFWEKLFWSGLWKIIWAWGEFFIGRWLFGYGEKPLRPLFAGVVVVLVCSFLFWKLNGIDPNSPCSFLSSLYFSVVTFTTLGYGDLQPTVNMRWLSGIEAVLGVALMAMFIVALARKFTR